MDVYTGRTFVVVRNESEYVEILQGPNSFKTAAIREADIVVTTAGTILKSRWTEVTEHQLIRAV